MEEELFFEVFFLKHLKKSGNGQRDPTFFGRGTPK
jgi:hypothetical protein